MSDGRDRLDTMIVVALARCRLIRGGFLFGLRVNCRETVIQDQYQAKDEASCQRRPLLLPA